MREQTTLVSHGWSKRCRVCERRTHAKWHDLAINELNPVAMIQFIESVLPPDGAAKIVGYVARVTGIDVVAMRATLESEQAVDAVDPVGELAERDPTTRASTSSSSLPAPPLTGSGETSQK